MQQESCRQKLYNFKYWWLVYLTRIEISFLMTCGISLHIKETLHKLPNKICILFETVRPPFP